MCPSSNLCDEHKISDPWDSKLIHMITDTLSQHNESNKSFFDKQNIFGTTPLMYCTYRNDITLVSQLLEKMNADPFKTNLNGLSAFSIALFCSNNTLVRMFLEKKSDPMVSEIIDSFDINGDETFCEHIIQNVRESVKIKNLLSMNNFDSMAEVEFVIYRDLLNQYKKIILRIENENLPSGLKQQILGINFPEKIPEFESILNLLYKNYIELIDTLTQITIHYTSQKKYGKQTLELLFERLIRHTAAIMFTFYIAFIEPVRNDMIDGTDRGGRTVLRNAIYRRTHPFTINRLIELGASPFQIDQSNKSVFCDLIYDDRTAIYGNYCQILRKFIETKNRPLYHSYKSMTDTEMCQKIIDSIDDTEIKQLFSNQSEMNICKTTTANVLKFLR